jgi:hypothetical protein
LDLVIVGYPVSGRYWTPGIGGCPTSLREYTKLRLIPGKCRNADA